MGQAVSFIGDSVFDTTLVLWVGIYLLRGQTYAPAAVAAVLLCVAVATMVVSPFAGVLVDRWDRRRVMLATDLVRAALIGVLAVAAFLPAGVLPTPVMLTLVYAVVLLTTAAGRFFYPARGALIGDVVTGDADRAKASGLGQASMAVAGIVGPPLAAPLLFTIGVPWALLVNALSFVVSFLAVRAVRVPVEVAPPAPAASRSMRRELGAALVVIGRSRLLVALTVAIVVATLGTGAINALGVFFVTDNLHASANLYGTLGMAIGIGAIVGALAAGFLAGTLGSARVFSIGLLLTGILLVVFGRTTDLLVAVLVIGIAGFPIAALNTATQPLILQATPREYLGRVLSVINPLQQLASMLSILVSGWLASTVLVGFHATLAGVSFGRLDTIYVASGLLMVAGGVYAVVAMRGADRQATLAR